MLILSRNTLMTAGKTSSEVVVTIPPSDKPRTVVVTLVENRGEKSRLGFDGPPEITFDRREVHSRKTNDIEELYRVDGGEAGGA